MLGLHVNIAFVTYIINMEGGNNYYNYSGTAAVAAACGFFFCFSC
jgi:hypothetical protein